MIKQFGYIALITAVVIGIAIVGVPGVLAAQRSATININVRPNRIKAGQSVSVTIKEDSGTAFVNAAQVVLTYPQDQLKFVSVDSSSSNFTILAQESGADGKVIVARGTSTPVRGTKTVGIVNFQALAATTDNVIKVDTNSSAVVSSDDSANILRNSTYGSESGTASSDQSNAAGTSGTGSNATGSNQQIGTSNTTTTPGQQTGQTSHSVGNTTNNNTSLKTGSQSSSPAPSRSLFDIIRDFILGLFGRK